MHVKDGPGFVRRHPYRAASILAGLAVVVLLIIAATIVPFSSESARRGVIAALEEQLDAQVELNNLQFRLLPTFRAEGNGLTIRHKGRRDVPPLIAVDRFSAEGKFSSLLRRHVSRLEVERLEIQIPPDRNREPGTSDGDKTPSAEHADSRAEVRLWVIDELTSKDGQLVIIPRDPDKDPKVWSIHALRMTSVSADGAMPFEATLTNAVPPGEIETSGTFGPWQREEPGETPLAGAFSFARADLSVFKGISGILSSTGMFGGTLERIDVHGETNTPDFTVEASGHPFALKTSYHAIVDGTNGDTFLDEVNASFLHSTLIAKGAVVGTKGRKGRTVTLDVVMDRGRLEDVLTMAVKTSKPPMTGGMKLRTKFVLPPGDRDVVQKLQLDGRFQLADARFTNGDVQNKINSLSKRTQGNVDDEVAQRVSSQFVGTFTLLNSQLTIPEVTFDVPGSTVRLAGQYGLVNEEIDFQGTAFTDASISQMTTGWKSVLLKPVDLLFRKKGGGAAIPIKIGGTRNDPSFGLDKGRVFKRRPDQGE